MIVIDCWLHGLVQAIVSEVVKQGLGDEYEKTTCGEFLGGIDHSMSAKRDITAQSDKLADWMHVAVAVEMVELKPRAPTDTQLLWLGRFSGDGGVDQGLKY